MKESFTGMTWCPKRTSHISLMRCWEYQQQYNCGVGCIYRVTNEQHSFYAAATISKDAFAHHNSEGKILELALELGKEQV